MMSTAGGLFKELPYDVHQLGREMLDGKRIPSEDSIKDIVNDAEKQIEQLIYKFDYDLAPSATDSIRSKLLSYYSEILSRDDKFMRGRKNIRKYTQRLRGWLRTKII